MDIRITDYTTGTKPPCARAKPLPAHRHMKHRHDAEPAEPCRTLPKPAEILPKSCPHGIVSGIGEPGRCDR